MKKMKHLGIIALAAVLLALVTGCKHDPEPEPIPKTYTVTFNSSGGTSVNPQTVTAGGKAAEPAAPTKANDAAGLYAGTPPASYTLDGWYNGGAKWNFAADAVTADITLTAKWAAPATIDLAGESGNNVVEKTVSYVNANPGSAYTLVLGEDVSGATLQRLNQNNTTLSIISDGTTERKISFGNEGFIVGGTTGSPRNAKLVIDGHVTLQGKTDNSTPLVGVYYGGSLDLKGNAKITGNSTFIAGGIDAQGGIDSGEGVSITMSGNVEISGNTATNLGGGINLAGNITFTMSGNALIKNNNASNGGGVSIGNQYVVFVMNGGEISNNTATTSGGGVRNYGTFTVASEQVKTGIHNNTAPIGQGPQVFVNSTATFTVGGEPAVSY
jgi:uncharacterized repeat protein (TIGR02543 family)